MAKKSTQSDARQSVFEAALARFARVADLRARRHGYILRKIALLRRFARLRVIAPPDPVSVAIFAIDRVGPAAVRACASGVEVCVAAPDEATAAILRTALAETARRRGTDRLIRIVVD